MNNGKTRFHIDHVHFAAPLDYETFKLIQVGRRYCEKNECIDTHWQNEYYEMTIVTDGSGYITTNGVETPVKAGDIYLSFPFELHELRASDKERFEYDFFSFRTDGPFKSELEKLNADFYNPALRLFSDERVSDLVATVVAEVSKEKLHSKELIASIFTQIIVYTLRGFSKIEKSTVNISEPEILCQQIMAYIDSNIHSLVNLAQLAEKFGYNYTYLSALFKKTTNNTLSSYYRKRKLAISKALLNEGKMTVGKIAEKLGYSSPFAFSAAFKKMYGISPKSYKEYSKSLLRTSVPTVQPPTRQSKG